jgi:uncharacterized protein YdaU (DUF1376 family)
MFVDDFFGGTMRWKGEAQALYGLLLMHQWASWPLPKDLGEIADAIRYDEKLFRKLWETVQKKFRLTSDGWVNVRLEEHREKSRQLAATRAEIGKRGGKASAQAKAQAKVQANEQQTASNSSSNCSTGGEPQVNQTGKQISTIQSNPSLRGLPGGRG